MSPESIFEICNSIALVGWLVLLLVSPFVFEIDKFLVGVVITLLAIVYIWLITQSFNLADMKSFGSLDGVMSLFENKLMVTAGWVHYLAFDLFVGAWIKRNSVFHNISHWLIIPCLLFTFMMGPFGLLVYLLIRYIVTKNYFESNFV